MLADRYGLPVSSTSEIARDAYVAGADCILSAVAGWRKHFGSAIEADPEFALAHIGYAGQIGDVPRFPAHEILIR